MTPRIVALGVALLLMAASASAQDTIKSSSVPKAVVSQISKSAAKKALCRMMTKLNSTENSTTIVPENNLLRINLLI